MLLPLSSGRSDGGSSGRPDGSRSDGAFIALPLMVRVAAAPNQALHARHRGAAFRRQAVEIEGLVPHADHGRPGAQHQAAADAIDHQQVVFHARVDHGLAAVAAARGTPRAPRGCQGSAGR